MKRPLNSLHNPKVVLDLDGYLANHPEAVKDLEGMVIIPYLGGPSRPMYGMCDTVAMTATPRDDLEELYRVAKKSAPCAYQVIFYGKGIDQNASGEEAIAICIDWRVRLRQEYVC